MSRKFLFYQRFKIGICIFGGFIFMVLISGCASQPTTLLPTQTATITPSPSMTPSATPTTTPSSTSTMTPTETATPSPTVTASATPTPTPMGNALGVLLDVCLDSYECQEEKLLFLDLATGEYEAIGEASIQLLDISPDGTQILYSQAGSLYIMENDGSDPKFVTDGFDDSDRPGAYWGASDEIIYIGEFEEQNAIFMIKPDGSDRRRVSEKKQIYHLYPSYDNEGVFWVEGYSTRGGSWSLGDWWSSKDGTEQVKMDAGYFTSQYFRPKFSPTGQLAIYIDEIITQQMFIATTNGSYKIQNIGVYSSTLGFDPDSLIGGSINARESFISPDEKKIIIEEVICSPSCDDFYHYLISPDGSLIAELPKEMVRILFHGSWSPDSQLFFYYMSTRSEEGAVPALLNLDTMEISKFADPVLGKGFIRNLKWLPVNR